MESISEFTVSCGWMELKNNVKTADLLINGGTYTANMNLVNYDELKFTLEKPISKDGRYSIIIPEGSFLIGWEGDSSPLIEFVYTVENGSGGGDDPDVVIQNTVPEGYTFVPAAGTEIPVLTSFSVVADTETFLTPASRKSKITINGEQVDAIASSSGELDNTLTWTLADPINPPGNYTVYIPEGSFYGYSEVDNQHFIVTLVVTGGDLPEPDYFDGEVTSDPTSGTTVGQLKKIAVQYPKLTSAYVGPKAFDITVTKGDEAIEAPYTLTPDEDSFNEAHVVWLEFDNAITAEGSYTLSFPARCFEIAKYPNNWYSAPFTLTFNVSDDAAITDIDADSRTESAEFFNLNGRKISTPVCPGVYIRRTATATEKIVIR